MNDVRRHHKLGIFFVDNASAFAANTPFVNEVGLHATRIVTLDGLIPKKDVVTSGITMSKTELKHNLAYRAAVICDKARHYALTFANPTLAAQMKTREDLIYHLNDENILGFMTNIQSKLNPLLADPNFIPYNITGTILGDLVTDATTFDGMIGQADNLAATGTVANQDINNLLDKDMHQNIEHFDMLIKEYKVSNYDFWLGYHVNSAIDDLGIHHTSVLGTVIGPTPPDDPAGAPIIGATVKILGTPKVATTNVLGQYLIPRTKSGDYQLEVSAPGRVTKTQTVKIIRSHSNTFNFSLLPA